MAPKKDKNIQVDDAWRTNIINAPVNDDSCRVKVVMFEAAGSDQDRIYLNKFETFATEEKRFVIKNICKTETIFMVNQLGVEKKVKDDNLRVFEEGQAYLKEKKDMPPEMLALIIKHLILKIREEYLFIERQRLVLKEGMHRESTTMIANTEVRGTVNVPPPEPVEPQPPPAKGKKDAKETSIVIPEPEEGKKYNTMLRVRGEEWRDKVYVDDFPIDGPNLYIAVTGFVEPLLPSCLIQIGIPISALVQIRIDPITTKVPSTLFRATKRGQSTTELLAETAMKFWEEIQTLRITKPSEDIYKDTAFVVFSPPYWDSEKLSGTPESIYDELCFLMYDIQDLTRQHSHYLENMDIINIPEEVKDERYIKYYLSQIDELPLECVTCYSVLDSMLHTVCNSQEIVENNNMSSLSSAVTDQQRKSLGQVEKVERSEALVKEVFNTLFKTDANRKAYRLTYGTEYEDHKPPIVIEFGDFAKYPTFHLGNINLESIVWNSLYCMPLHKLWESQDRLTGELEAKINFHVNVLLSCFERNDIETAELTRLIHILACRKLYNNRSSLKKNFLAPVSISEFKKVYLKRSVLAEPLPRTASLIQSSSTYKPSFSSMTKSENGTHSYETTDEDDIEANRIKFLFDCPDISELISAAELTNGAPINHMIDDFEYFEDFSGISSFQMLLDVFNKYNCVDYKYCEVTDCFLLMFFNSHDKDGVTRDEWRHHLDTPLCIQDFFDFVLEEIYDWVQAEEKNYDELQTHNTHSDSKVHVDPNALQSCIAEVDVASDLLMEGSLKYQELAKIEDELDDMDTASTSLQKSSSPTSTDVDSKSSKKVKASPTPQKRKQSFAELIPDIEPEIPEKPYLGYDISDRRVEIFGKDASYFSRDGTRVTSKYTMVIPSNEEYILMNVIPGNSCNEFWMHRALGDNLLPDMIDSCESFRITSKDQVLINIKKQTYKMPIPVASLTDTNIEIDELFETYSYHSLYVTWPNGLITESIYEDNSPVISHIKQYHTSSTLNLHEKKRCISLNGEVLIFKENGDVEVLRPDGSFIKITKYYDRLIIPEENDELLTELSSDKSKKGKGKEKPKDKDSKDAKSKKSIEVKEEKPSQYEFIIEEFEYTETTGLRQKWVDNVPYHIEKLLIRIATDYCLGEVFSRRMDGTHSLLNKDGLHIVSFPDKTRIISQFIIEDDEIYPEWDEDEMFLFDTVSYDNVTETTKASLSQKSYIISQGSVMSGASSKKVDIKPVVVEEEELSKEVKRTDGYVSVQMLYSVENCNFTTVTINKANKKISVESPNNTEVVIDSNNCYTIKLDNVTTATFNGQNLNISYEACAECRSFTTCNVKIRAEDQSSVTKFQLPWLKMKDSFSKRIVVNEEGSITLMDEPYSDESVHPEDGGFAEDSGDVVDDHQADGKSEGSTVSHGKCREMYLAKTIRFFVMRRDLTCSELIHRSLLELYERQCRWQPWCSINQYDTFGDQRNLLSILTPVHLTETEKWLMESKLSDKPKYLTYKDLKNDCGKGFYKWMRPYERFQPKPIKPENVLPPRLPRAFVLRTVEHQWKEEERENYKGAKELLVAILRYRRTLEADSETLLHVPLVDMRPEDERRIDDIIQALAHRIYEDLKARLAEDVQSRAKADITTRPYPVAEEQSFEDGLEEEEVDPEKQLEEERQILVQQVEDAEPSSPNLRRYWRRRAEEYKEEQFYKYLLREGSVPPYFRNILGGAIWWDMNDTAEEAVTTAERRKMKCVCIDEASHMNSA